MIWLWFGIALAQAKTISCEFGFELTVGKSIYKKCEITGHSGMSPTYYAHCDLQPEDRQLEFAKGEAQAHWIDSTSRKELARCSLKSVDVNAMVREYEVRAEKIEKPTCYLSDWKGQVMLVANGKRSRCSFKMNPKNADLFKTKTGIAAAFQCEHEYFLVSAEKNETKAFAKSGDSWKYECSPLKRVGDPVENVDWKNPPDYYDPNLETPGPKSGSP